MKIIRKAISRPSKFSLPYKHYQEVLSLFKKVCPQQSLLCKTIDSTAMRRSLHLPELPLAFTSPVRSWTLKGNFKRNKVCPKWTLNSKQRTWFYSQILTWSKIHTLMQLLWIYWNVIGNKASKISSYVGMYELVTHFSEVFRVEKYNHKQTSDARLLIWKRALLSSLFEPLPY